MADETVTVEWLGTATKMNQTLDRLNAKFDAQEKNIQRLANTSKKGSAEAATGFNKLEKEFNDNVKALKKLELGSKAFTAQKRKVDALRASLQKAKASMGGVGGTISSSLGAGVAKMAALGAGMLGFQAIVSVVVGELEKINKMKLEASAQTKTFEQALADVGLNIGPEAIPEARETILREAPKLGVSQEGLANLIGVAVSAGAKDLEQAMQLSAAALKVTAGSAERAQAFVGGTLDVASLGQSTNFEGALGQLLQVGSQVRATDPAAFADAIGPGLAAATANGQNQEGMTTERALEIAATISQIIKDPTGSNTATAMRQFVVRMDSFAPKLKKTLKDGTKTEVTTDQINEFKSAKTFDERLALLQGNENLGRQFLELQKEGIGKTAVREIVGKSDRAVAFEAKAAEAITSIEGAVPRFQQQVSAVGVAAPHLLAANRAQAARDAAKVRGGDDTAGAVLEIVQEGMKAVNLSGVDEGFFGTQGKILTDIQGKELLGEKDPFKTGIAALEEAKETRKLFGLIPIGGEVSAEHKALLQTQIDEIKALRVVMQQQAAPQGNIAIPNAPAAPPQVRVVAPPMRPKEAPLPAVAAP